MKTANQILACLLLAGTMLAVPVTAAELTAQASPESDQMTDKYQQSLPEPCMKNGCPQLSFTDAQLEKLSTLKDQYELATAAKKATLKSLKCQVHKLMTEPNIDRQKITGLHDKINSLRTELSNIRLGYSLDRAEVLTPEQRSKMRHFFLTRQVMGHRWHHKFWQHHGSEQPRD